MRSISYLRSAFGHAFGVGLQALLIVAIVATVLLLMSPVYRPAEFLAGTSKVDAGRGYPGKLWADPDVVDRDGYFDIHGCGYDRDLGNVIVAYGGGAWGSPLDSDGCFAIEGIPAGSVPGEYDAYAKQKVGKRWRVTGETTVTIRR